MWTDFLNTLKEVTIFMLAGQMLLRLLPEGYEKYARVIMGVMILALLTGPLLTAASLQNQESYDVLLQRYQQEMERIAEEVAASGLEDGDYAGQGLSDTVNTRLASVAEEWGVYVTDVWMDEEGKLTISVEPRDKTQVRRIRIEPVTVHTGEEEERSAPEETQRETSKMQEEMRAAFAGALELEEEKLEVIRNE